MVGCFWSVYARGGLAWGVYEHDGVSQVCACMHQCHKEVNEGGGGWLARGENEYVLVPW